MKWRKHQLQWLDHYVKSIYVIKPAEVIPNFPKIHSLRIPLSTTDPKVQWSSYEISYEFSKRLILSKNIPFHFQILNTQFWETITNKMFIWSWLNIYVDWLNSTPL